MRGLFITLFLLSAFCHSVNAQRYKDVFPEIANANSDEEALSLLKSFMVENLDHPNANLRLALIYEKRYLQADPLTEYERAIANAKEAQLRFLKASTLVDERDVNKNTGWYAGFSSGFDNKGRPIVQYSSVQQKIKNGYDSAQLFIEKLPSIYEAFTESVDFYDRAIKIFAEINGNYTSLDRLLLLYDQSLNEQLELLKVNYDSSIYYLDQYIRLIKDYPIKKYHQTYTVKPIKTYRLEGLLTSPNFLINNIEIWNYKDWANQVQKSVETEISNLRASLAEAENKLNNNISLINKQVYNDNFEPYIIDKKLEFELRKFDNESLPVSLLKYKEFKQKLLLKYNATQSYDSTMSQDLLNAYYGELIYLSNDADSLLKIVKNRLDPESLKKYPDYLSTYYQNKTGIESFVAKEQNQSGQYLTLSVENIRREVLGELVASQNKDPEYYTYGRLKIPSKTEEINVDSLDYDFHTNHKVKSADGSTYLSGLVKSSRGDHPVKAFAIKADEKNNVQWYKEYELIEDPTGNQVNLTGNMLITPEGCALSIYSFDQAIKKNTIIYLDENGEELFLKQLETKAFPRLSKYIENNSSLLFTFRGDSIQNSLSVNHPLEMHTLNLIGDVLWHKDFDFAGNTEALITTSYGFMVIGNYSKIKNIKGEELVTRINSGQTNAFSVAFDHLGNITSVRALTSSEKYVINKVIKINDSVINLLGFRDPSGKPTHSIINQFNELIYTDL